MRRPTLSSIALDHIVVLGALMLASAELLANDRGLALSCESARTEKALLRHAPKSVRRVHPHVLEIHTIKGTQRFVDQPPHDEGMMGGLHWRYCGFSPAANAHLVEMTEDGLRSGKLLFEASWKLLPAGHTVLFSPNGQAYLAVEQQDGVDGEHWAVYDANGLAKWKGYAGVTATMDGIESVTAQFDRPRWTGQGQLVARFKCTSSPSEGTAKFEQTASGGWGWRAPTCTPSDASITTDSGGKGVTAVSPAHQHSG